MFNRPGKLNANRSESVYFEVCLLDVGYGSSKLCAGVEKTRLLLDDTATYYSTWKNRKKKRKICEVTEGINQRGN